MSKIEEKQHVPIFVGSTFVDLKEYRYTVRDALHRLEAIVRGMEYFGSKPGAPIDECLSAVRTCKVYIGIFGMRYGSIPYNCEKSMTHLEYEEAQRHSLPSLIYIIDDEKQPVLPKYVEIGVGAEKLRDLKELLQKKHLVSKFTTEEDLSSKILHDIPPVLEELGNIVNGTLASTNIEETVMLLNKFNILPKKWQGREVTIDIIIQDVFASLNSETASTLNIQIGGSVGVWASFVAPEDIVKRRWRFYGEGSVAEQLIDLPENSTISVRAITIFGIGSNIHVLEDESKIVRPVKTQGLLIKEILDIK